MAFKVSTGLRNYMLSTGSAKAALAAGFIKIYAGAVPATADDAIGSATLLCTISNNSTGTGINFDAAAVGATLAKAPAEVWSGVNAATGTATFYRHVAVGDDGTQSTSQARIQGAVGTALGEMLLSSTSLTQNAPQALDYYSVALPTA